MGIQITSMELVDFIQDSLTTLSEWAEVFSLEKDDIGKFRYKGSHRALEKLRSHLQDLSLQRVRHPGWWNGLVILMKPLVKEEKKMTRGDFFERHSGLLVVLQAQTVRVRIQREGLSEAAAQQLNRKLLIRRKEGLNYIERTLRNNQRYLPKVNRGAESAFDQIKNSGSFPISIPDDRGYFNAGFFSEEGGIPYHAQHRLVPEQHYLLGVNIGRHWGLGAVNTPIPTSVLKLIESEYPEAGLQLIIFAPKTDQEWQKGAVFNLGRRKNQPIKYFDIRFPKAGRYQICILLFMGNQLLMNRTVEVVVGQELQLEEGEQSQSSHISFAKVDDLTGKALKKYRQPDRALTIVAQQAQGSGNYYFHYFNGEGNEIKRCETRLNFGNLSQAMANVRDALAVTMKALAGLYRGSGSKASETILLNQLKALADYGREFYRLMFPDGDAQCPPPVFEAGKVIQVAKISAQLSLPWELLYEQPMTHHGSDEISLCSTFHEHGAHTRCPDFENENVVCPYGFWGLKYIIEQLPHTVDVKNVSELRAKKTVLESKRLFKLFASLYDLPGLADHLDNVQTISTYPEVELKTANSRSEVKELLKTKGSQTDLLYFLTHGRRESDRSNRRYLMVGKDEKIYGNDLDAWVPKDEYINSLLFLNACGSAEYSPEDTDNILDLFFRRGALGAIGTQCTVTFDIAFEFFTGFLSRFLDAQSMGEALFQTRSQLFEDHHDIRGLAYSLFADAEIRIDDSKHE